MAIIQELFHQLVIHCLIDVIILDRIFFVFTQGLLHGASAARSQNSVIQDFNLKGKWLLICLCLKSGQLMQLLRYMIDMIISSNIVVIPLQILTLVLLDANHILVIILLQQYVCKYVTVIYPASFKTTKRQKLLLTSFIEKYSPLIYH
ncbi:unnamed protein product [Paramecium octaurelia]|uniref:Uncharacterized protein n=1 Tax=Paramecium octaurelia TaxID=43137 RepID=A0A8S1V027_PAROT|nr:unnamed protein product [Paramecium octaurelia]